jgi:squalene-associated FAD-dependent desaturase
VDVGAQLNAARVAVVGGGYGGLAAAVELAAAGIDVTLFEAGRNLGGRARRIEIGGARVDNGQHLLIGAYSETLRLLHRVDAGNGLVRRRLRLAFDDGFELAAPLLPAPLHLGAALARATLSWQDRAAAWRFMRKLQATGFVLPWDTSVVELLDELGQPADLRRHLWEPLCYAALNTPPQRASAQVYANVLRDSLAGPRAASDLLHPAVDLSEFFPEPAARFVRARGGRVLTGRAIRSLRIAPGGFELGSESGSADYTHVVVAVAPYHLGALLGDLPAMAPLLKCVRRLRFEPIATAYFAYADSVRLREPMLGLAAGQAQWLFDRGQLSHQPGLIAAVISASGDWQSRPRDELLRQLQIEVEAQLLQPAPLQWSRLIVERRATFACEPGMERPSMQTPLPRLLLAGDYVACDYPATLEAAVRSGVAAARSIIGEAAA